MRNLKKVSGFWGCVENNYRTKPTQGILRGPRSARLKQANLSSRRFETLCSPSASRLPYQELLTHSFLLPSHILPLTPTPASTSFHKPTENVSLDSEQSSLQMRNHGANSSFHNDNTMLEPLRSRSSSHLATCKTFNPTLLEQPVHSRMIHTD